MVSVLIIFNIYTLMGASQVLSFDYYDGYYLYLYNDGGDYPNLANPGWHEEAQGITHDENNWFITQTWALWMISVDLDLASPGIPNNTPGLYMINIANVPALANEGYNHFGDLTYYKYDGQGYLLVAIEIWPSDDIRPGVAVFSADTLQYIAHAPVSGQIHGPWCAVDQQTGTLYTSDQPATVINRWAVDWNSLKTNGALVLQNLPSLIMTDSSGNPLTLQGTQGGVVSPSGELLYVVANGIHVLELSTGKQLMKSTNGYGHFNFHFIPDLVNGNEEPEGITIWDLDNGRAPGISGQLHAIMLDNDLSSDEVTIEHFTNTIRVNSSYTGPSSQDKNGTPSYPFKTFNDANNLVWNRAIINAKTGSYPESITFTKQIKLVSEEGLVRIGQ